MIARGTHPERRPHAPFRELARVSATPSGPGRVNFAPGPDDSPGRMIPRAG